MKTRIVLAGICLLGATMVGCASAEKERAAAVEVAKAVVIKVVDKAKIDQSTMSASAQVTNPEYQFEFFGGTGFYANGKVRMIGVDVKGAVAGGGSGETVPDQDLRERIDRILSRQDLRQEQKDGLIAEVTKSWLVLHPTTRPGDQ